MSRTQYVKKNVLWSNINLVCSSLLAFVCRTVFIYSLGATYLGVNGLFTNILGLLSFSELGIGTAINYSLYKPIAQKDYEKIKSLMRLYRRAYFIIALVIAILGIGIIPFLDLIVNVEQDIGNITLYYCIFLFNTVSSYFVTYKYAYINARQENYYLTTIDTVAGFFSHIMQIVVLLVFKNFTLYLIIQSLCGVGQKIIAVILIDRKYPLLKERDALPLEKEEMDHIKRNVSATVIHKLGDACVNQTDNILVSTFVSTTAVGLISNYTMINSMIMKFAKMIFNSVTASLGNLVAKESIEKQKSVFDIYSFIGFWVFGFIFIAFMTLIQPFIDLWIGKTMQLDDLTVVLFFAAQFLYGQSMVFYNFKVASGIFNEDKWFAFAQAVVNLVVSIWAIKLIGLPGVYVGTIAQRLIVIIGRPIIVYKKVFKCPVSDYFIKLIKYSVVTGCVCALMVFMRNRMMVEVSIGSFIGCVLATAIVPNICFALMYCRSKEFKAVVNKIKLM